MSKLDIPLYEWDHEFDGDVLVGCCVEADRLLLMLGGQNRRLSVRALVTLP